MERERGGHAWRERERRLTYSRSRSDDSRPDRRNPVRDSISSRHQPQSYLGAGGRARRTFKLEEQQVVVVVVVMETRGRKGVVEGIITMGTRRPEDGSLVRLCLNLLVTVEQYKCLWGELKRITFNDSFIDSLC
ncbi:hypothetical protein F2Q69_00004428 [Brassica cretica]|uniref:Uncharacterized protein n=1 Tax=Brassica cretica TaxID=69181 RepID=A0A8S9NSW1_BRACR|nr:hypothetical protein F2Q69_00004428 [Brassica cretica]